MQSRYILYIYIYIYICIYIIKGKQNKLQNLSAIKHIKIKKSMFNLINEYVTKC